MLIEGVGFIKLEKAYCNKHQCQVKTLVPGKDENIPFFNGHFPHFSKGWSGGIYPKGEDR